MGGVLGKIGDFISSAVGNIFGPIADAVDRFVTTPDERNNIKEELLALREKHLQNERQFLLELRRLERERETELEQRIRSELDARKEVILAELNQGDKYTKRARPTVVYVGLGLILLELIGMRYLIFDWVGMQSSMIESSDAVFKTFLIAWASVLGVY